MYKKPLQSHHLRLSYNFIFFLIFNFVSLNLLFINLKIAMEEEPKPFDEENEIKI